MEERTTFEETIVENGARLPSLTLCQDSFNKEYNNNPIESFEDVAEEIENIKTKYKIMHYEYKPSGEAEYLNETMNEILMNDWYFAPRISFNQTLICLISSHFGAQKVSLDSSIGVSYYYNVNIFLKYMYCILVSLYILSVRNLN